MMTGNYPCVTFGTLPCPFPPWARAAGNDMFQHGVCTLRSNDRD
jgi:hypothetical protein